MKMQEGALPPSRKGATPPAYLEREEGARLLFPITACA